MSILLALGSTCDDPFLDWVEAQEAKITTAATEGHGNVPMHDKSLPLKEVSRQHWAMLNPLLGEPGVACAFANVTLHNGLEAWRRLAGLINEGKTLLHNDLAQGHAPQGRGQHGWGRGRDRDMGHRHLSLPRGRRTAPARPPAEIDAHTDFAD